MLPSIEIAEGLIPSASVGSCNLACSLCNSLLPYGGVSSVGAPSVPALVSLERRVRFDLLKSFSAEGAEEARGLLRPLRNSLEPAYFASYLLEFAGRVKGGVVKVLIRSFASWAAEVLWHLLSSAFFLLVGDIRVEGRICSR